jgi:ribonuclease HII
LKELIVGIDEVGRGCIAGPVVAASVILGSSRISLLKDSKKLSKNHREIISAEIKDKCLEFSIGIVSSKIIDRINIREASLLAMKKSLEKLKSKNLRVIVDGKDKIETDYPCEAIIKADGFINEVMAASIVAKAYRDELMDSLHKKYPNYFFNLHKGYPTKKHLDALKSFGIIKEHRKTFAPVKNI